MKTVIEYRNNKITVKLSQDHQYINSIEKWFLLMKFIFSSKCKWEEVDYVKRGLYLINNEKRESIISCYGELSKHKNYSWSIFLSMDSTSISICKEFYSRFIES